MAIAFALAAPGGASAECQGDKPAAAVGEAGTVAGPASQEPGGVVPARPRIGGSVDLSSEDLDADGDGSVDQAEFAQFETEQGTLYRRKQEGASPDTPALTQEPGMRDNYSEDIGKEEVPPTGGQ